MFHAIEAWNLMGGLDWAGIEATAEILGFRDIELLAVMLATIRDHQNQGHEHGDPAATR